MQWHLCIEGLLEDGNQEQLASLPPVSFTTMDIIFLGAYLPLLKLGNNL
jgi:hypothetical protein